MLSVLTRDELAADLAEAERTRVPIAPLTDRNPTIDVVDAYEIQLINIHQRVAEGARVVGHKVGLSSKAMQQMMGVDEPDYGHLLDEMQAFEDTPVKAGSYLYPRVEVEVGFVLAEDLPGAECTEDDGLAATAASPTGRSSCATPSPTTPRRPGSCWAPGGWRPRLSTSRASARC